MATRVAGDRFMVHHGSGKIRQNCTWGMTKFKLNAKQSQSSLRIFQPAH
jgi:hypothetical protein